MRKISTFCSTEFCLFCLLFLITYRKHNSLNLLRCGKRATLQANSVAMQLKSRVQWFLAFFASGLGARQKRGVLSCCGRVKLKSILYFVSDLSGKGKNESDRPN